MTSRALARRDRSRAHLRARLRERRAPPLVESEVLAALESAGLVDDRRLARRRAAALAARGWGDAAIAARLEREGLDDAEARAALEELPPEVERARTVAAGVAEPRRAASLLARRGFSFETIEDVLSGLDENA